jgi:adenylate kinase
VLFGPPGAGKGTQAQLLRDRWQLVHVSSGDLFRWNLQEQTPLGLKAGEFMNQGLLVPDEVTIDIVLEKVLFLAAKEGFILDGFPRNTNQAQVLEEALELRSRSLDKVVHIDLPEEELLRRLGGRFSCRECQSPHNIGLTPVNGGSQRASEGKEFKCQQCGGELYQRADDSPDAVGRRIEVYRRETMPVLDFYRNRDMLVDVAGSGTIQIVNERVLAALKHR